MSSLESFHGFTARSFASAFPNETTTYVGYRKQKARTEFSKKDQSTLNEW